MKTALLEVAAWTVGLVALAIIILIDSHFALTGF
jgi:hypothetical protein